MITKTKEQNESPKRQFCTFIIYNRLFGVDILSVKEVNPQVKCVPIYHAPPEVRGYINIRGQIYLILDSQSILGFEPASASDTTANQRIILFKSTIDEPFGIIVDRISDVVTIEVDRIENSCSELAHNQRSSSKQIECESSDLSEGIAKLDDQLLVILNPHTLLRIATASLNVRQATSDRNLEREKTSA